MSLHPVNHVPSVSDVIEALRINIGRILPDGLVRLVAKYAMHRFDEQMFGPEFWKTYYGAIPVALPSIERLRDRVLQLVISTGRNTGVPINKMCVSECANFVGELGMEEHPEPPEELYTCLNTPVRPGEKVAGLSCAVTYIPQYVRKDNRVIPVTLRTLGSVLGPHPKQGHPATLNNSDITLDQLSPDIVHMVEPSCFFVMELNFAPESELQSPPASITKISQQGDGMWAVPAVRNFVATIFSRRVWKGELQYGRNPCKYTYCSDRSEDDYYVASGGFGDDEGLYIDLCFDMNHDNYGAAGSKKFLPKPQPLQSST